MFLKVLIFFLYRESINLAVLQLMEEGYLDGLKKKWWIDGSECGISKVKKSKTYEIFVLNFISKGPVTEFLRFNKCCWCFLHFDWWFIIITSYNSI
jgi:hypothetical protein